MRFYDPLAAMKFIGCSPPIQIFMTGYAATIYYKTVTNIKCDQQLLTDESRNFNQDVFIAIWMHLACSLLFIIKSFQKTLRFFGAYTRVFVTWTYAFLYFIGIMYMIFHRRLWS